MNDSKELKEAKADRAWWDRLGRHHNLGTLLGWNGRYSATFRSDTGAYSQIQGPILAALVRALEQTP